MERHWFVFIFTLSFLTYFDICHSCESGHIEFNGSCYYFSSHSSDFYSSKSSCEDLGMYVVDIGSQEEQNFMVENLPDEQENYWIGLTAVTWLDGSRLTYDYFGRRFDGAFNDGAHCFRMYPSSFKWYDKDCSENFLYICETESACNSSSYSGIEHDGSCYHFSESESDFSTSSSSCEDLGMHLVFVVSQDEQDFLIRNLPEDDEEYWIGLTSVNWAAEGSSLLYENFGSDSIAYNDGRVCYRMVSDSNFAWLDDSCSSIYRFICENEGASAPSTTLTTTVEEPSTDPVTESPGPTSQEPPQEEPPQEEPSQEEPSQEESSQEEPSQEEPPQGEPPQEEPPQEEPPQEPPTSATSFAATSNQVSSEATSETTGPATQTQATPATKTAGTTDASSTLQRAHKKSANFKLLSDNTALCDDYVRASNTGSSLIECGQQCFFDPLCSCFTYIASERKCVLGLACQGESGTTYERRLGAKTYH